MVNSLTALVILFVGTAQIVEFGACANDKSQLSKLKSNTLKHDETKVTIPALKKIMPKTNPQAKTTLDHANIDGILSDTKEKRDIEKPNVRKTKIKKPTEDENIVENPDPINEENVDPDSNMPSADKYPGENKDKQEDRSPNTDPVKRKNVKVIKRLKKKPETETLKGSGPSDIHYPNKDISNDNKNEPESPPEKKVVKKIKKMKTTNEPENINEPSDDTSNENEPENPSKKKLVKKIKNIEIKPETEHYNEPSETLDSNNDISYPHEDISNENEPKSPSKKKVVKKIKKIKKTNEPENIDGPSDDISNKNESKTPSKKKLVKKIKNITINSEIVHSNEPSETLDSNNDISYPHEDISNENEPESPSKKKVVKKINKIKKTNELENINEPSDDISNHNENEPENPLKKKLVKKVKNIKETEHSNEPSETLDSNNNDISYPDEDISQDNEPKSLPKKTVKKIIKKKKLKSKQDFEPNMDDYQDGGPPPYDSDLDESINNNNYDFPEANPVVKPKKKIIKKIQNNILNAEGPVTTTIKTRKPHDPSQVYFDGKFFITLAYGIH